MRWVFELPTPLLAVIGAVLVVATFVLLIVTGNWLHAFIAATYSSGWADFSIFCYIAFIVITVFIWAGLEGEL